jgi:predicted P-loop ATPase
MKSPLEIKRLYNLGFAIHFLHPKSKKPIELGWAAGPRKKWSELCEIYSPKYNVGVRLGTPSKIGSGYLTVIDVDIKSKDPRHLKEAITAIKKITQGVRCPRVDTGRGNGSRHYYCVSKMPFKTFNPAQSSEIIKVHLPSKKPSKLELEKLSKDEITQGIRLSNAWEISLYSDGRQVVLPPSIHPTSGKRYLWVRPVNSSDDLPLLEIETPKDHDTKLPDKLNSGPFSFEVTSVDVTTLPISKKIKEVIISGAEVTNRSNHLLPVANALYSAGLSRDEILSTLTDPKYFLSSCANERRSNRQSAGEWLYKYTVKKVIEEQKSKGKFPQSNVWRKSLTRNGEGNLTRSLQNVISILRNSTLEKPFWHNEFSNRGFYNVDTPWADHKNCAIKDIDVVLIIEWLGREFKLEPNENLVWQAIKWLAHKNSSNPIHDFILSQPWDGKRRVETWMKDYLNANMPDDYLRLVSRKFMCGMVARVFNPGIKFDHILVLEGKQGIGKSSVGRILASPEYFVDSLPDLRDKDARLNLVGAWVIELAELANLNHIDTHSFKSFLTAEKDRVRAPYGRLFEDFPRRSVFIGTTNEYRYLKDWTGNRRFFPVDMRGCDFAKLERDRQQIFAEAHYLLTKRNEPIYLNKRESDLVGEIAKTRVIESNRSLMEESFLDFIEQDQKKSLNKRFFKGLKFKISDLFHGDGPFADNSRLQNDNYAQQKAADILNKHGFEGFPSSGRNWWRIKKEHLDDKDSF